MAKKKSLFKKIRKEQSSVVAEPEAELDDLDMQSLDNLIPPLVQRQQMIALYEFS